MKKTKRAKKVLRKAKQAIEPAVTLTREAARKVYKDLQGRPQGDRQGHPERRILVIQGTGWNVGWTWTAVVLGILVLAPLVGKLIRK